MFDLANIHILVRSFLSILNFVPFGQLSTHIWVSCEQYPYPKPRGPAKNRSSAIVYMCAVLTAFQINRQSIATSTYF